MPTVATKIFTISDDRPGNRRPLGLFSEALAVRLNLTVEHLPAPETAYRWLGCAIQAKLLPYLDSKVEFLDQLSKGLVGDNIFIGCGRSSLPYMHWLRFQGHHNLIQLLDPYVGHHAFRAIILPQHDRRTGPNIIKTNLGITMPPRPDNIATQFISSLSPPICALIIGGNNRRQFMDETDLKRWRSILQAEIPQCHNLAVTYSRRTPQSIKNNFLDIFNEYNVMIYDGVGDNPYPGLVASSSYVAVTEDSINMISECAASATPMMLLPVQGNLGKFSVIQKFLAEKNRAHPTKFGSSCEPIWELPQLVEDVLHLLPPTNSTTNG